MFCPRCGTKSEQNHKYCQKCGFDLTGQSGEVSKSEAPVSIYKRIFGGRLNVRNFWLGIIVGLVFVFIGAFVDGMVLFILDETQQETGIISTIVFLLYFLFWISLSIRRMHDIGKPGWVLLGLFVPIVGTLLGIILGFFPGQNGDNQYGPQPKPKLNIKTVFGQ